ncbi:MAG: DUF2905 domain-containing protein [Candidatus Zixiibacteriota bacterium]
MLSPYGKIIIVAGIVLMVVGLVLLFAGRIPFLGKLPGDLTFRTGKTTVYIPIVTCLIISLLLTLIFNLFGRGR